VTTEASQRPFDEMSAGGAVRAAYRTWSGWLDDSGPDRLVHAHRQADILFRRLGITFAVYGDPSGADTERLIPFDVVPRILARAEWKRVSAGIRQRVRALNAFVGDVYGAQRILREKRVPEDLILRNPAYRPEMKDFTPPHGVWMHVAGIDLVRTGGDAFLVLEDNLRTPSGVSYMMENREVMMRLFPDLFDRHQVAPVNHYPLELLHTLRAAAPAGVLDPVVVVLTPGQFNSAYFEHAFLADEMGVELVQGQDLFVGDDGFVHMRTIKGPRRVDVIYRRIDDDFLDPRAFRPDSLLGVPGLFAAYRAGKVTLANAIGTGVADDKAVYAYVPEMIRFYLSEEPLLDNVPTRHLARPDDLAHVLDRLDEMVVKEVHGSGGYGMLIGPRATEAERAAYRKRILADPGGFIAQPTLSLSTCPTLIDGGLAPRHVDLRPFALYCDGDVTLMPGGLTRVALRAGSLVVNSSQGGGTKDTWVLER